MTTVADWVQTCKLHLLGNQREELNKLNGAVSAGATTLTFTYDMRSIQAGADVEIDSEVFRVMSVSSNTAIVMGAQLGSVAADHADGAVVTVNPRFYQHSIVKDLGNCLNDLDANGLYQEVAINITFNPTVASYDLTGSTTVLDVLEVRYKQTGPTKRFPVIRSWSLLRDMDTSVFPSGNALTVDAPGFPGLPLRVRYSAPFSEITALTQDVTADLGVSATAADLPPMGAAVRQMAGRDIKRSFLESQPDTRRAAEVQIGSAQQAIQSLRKQYQDGIAEERMRQLQRFPYRQTR